MYFQMTIDENGFCLCHFVTVWNVRYQFSYICYVEICSTHLIRKTKCCKNCKLYSKENSLSRKTLSILFDLIHYYLEIMSMSSFVQINMQIRYRCQISIQILYMICLHNLHVTVHPFEFLTD